ncbi:hypothetical protein RSK20926_14444 [Roseobacter sp. SK209-2-6]|uniref:class I SAM-dependent methyltransferase n=1 Tax=Roseobacter sp. SK209-2-6 TaxID=388739 RepID=UPI0000F3D526|nr:SAM-dependent methyltransferase [Roseobacter sp. SK209-2-6]EBA15838.1 hypothetical protein RSK20926_14444 [Roseobacter sp. SK209-2-6]
MSSLEQQLVARIQENGPISLAEYMSECLLHPEFGYYSTRDPFGQSGDFVTAPEISQMFGELLGLCLAQCWLDQGAPSPFALVELGPGRGTLMRDLLRATAGVTGFHQAMQVFLVEASPKLQREQAKALEEYDVSWVAEPMELPNLPVFLVANEFFDALPARQFVRDSDGWRERLIGLEEGKLGFGLGSATDQPALAYRLEDTRPGDLVELCSPAATLLEPIADRISTFGGAALIIDYGDWRSLGDTLQALRAHKSTPPLENPGKADLTLHVDFEFLAQSTKSTGCAHSRVTPQGVFLERLGITERAQALSRALQGEALDTLIAAHRRLTHPEEMGNLFKVLGLYPAQFSPPPGLLS